MGGAVLPRSAGPDRECKQGLPASRTVTADHHLPGPLPAPSWSVSTGLLRISIAGQPSRASGGRLPGPRRTSTAARPHVQLALTRCRGEGPDPRPCRPGDRTRLVLPPAYSAWPRWPWSPCLRQGRPRPHPVEAVAYEKHRHRDQACPLPLGVGTAGPSAIDVPTPRLPWAWAGARLAGWPRGQGARSRPGPLGRPPPSSATASRPEVGTWEPGDITALPRRWTQSQPRQGIRR
jgi:hypothetical protein